MRKKITIQDLIHGNDPTELRTRLGTLIESSRRNPETKRILHSEISDKIHEIARVVSEVKNVQWRITNYAVLLSAATIGLAKVFDYTKMGWCLRLFLSAVALSVVATIIGIALGMLAKTEKDLGYYRAHSKLAEECLNRLTSLLTLSNEIVVSEESSFLRKPDFTYSARENRVIFSVWFFVIVCLSGAFSGLVDIYLIWK
jgi:hypothetical protein